MSKEYQEKASEKMEKNIEAFKARLRRIRAGRAHPSLLESVNVVYYGTPTPLSNMATVSSPGPRTLLISPWDAGALKDIEHALVRASLGMAPQNDGKVIRLTVPELTGERREELAKEARKEAEKCQVDLRSSRRAALEEIKKAEKEKLISEDGQKRLSAEIQKIADSYKEKTEAILKAKEKEIREI